MTQTLKIGSYSLTLRRKGLRWQAIHPHGYSATAWTRSEAIVKLLIRLKGTGE